MTFVMYSDILKNRKNNNELHVGSECIKKFPDIENISVIRKTMREQLSLQNENKRRIQFSEIELDNVDYIKSGFRIFVFYYQQCYTII